MSETEPRRIKFARLTLDDRKRLTLEVVSESERFIVGYRVDREGGRVWKREVIEGMETFIVEKHMIERLCIVSYVELVENLTYGWLEPKAKAQPSSAERTRQTIRSRSTGRYKKVPCSSCGLGASVEGYCSHRDTDGSGPNGIGDALLRLCDPCAAYLDKFDGPRAVIEAAKIRASGKRAPRLKKEGAL